METFIPSKHGFLFKNDFLKAPALRLHTGKLGTIEFGRSSGGLSGGMIYAALDYLHDGDRIPRTSRQLHSDTNLFAYLCRRQVDSLDIPRGIWKFYNAMKANDRQLLTGATFCHAREAVLTLLRRGELCPLGLVTVNSLIPDAIGQCHQVLAYALASGKDSKFRVYDPCFPGNDNAILTADVEDGSLEPAHVPVRHFFATDYDFVSPPIDSVMEEEEETADVADFEA